ncbi:WAT1-related protein At4g08290-like isoform X2 [Cicer arietinum]|uniref:WAT1-related protein n=1 Tax=Cicer arietinum TaxID=3827 RepID=A0A3Q7XZY1_CICAR|nr:WAT1-related protein At4g08290-like isoform X2 [Cicer arietinum]
MGAWLRNAKPYLLLLAVQFGSAVMFIFAMDAINKGMSHYVFIVYRNAIAAVTLAPFAFFLERKVRPKMTPRVFSEIMALAFFELEHMKIKEVACQAKLIGTAITFGGTLLMALYKGPVVSVVRSSINHATQPQNVDDPTGNRWIIGTCFLLIGCAGFSSFYILQAITLRKYPAEMSLATWVCFIGALQSFVVAFFAERHHSHAWSLGWDTRLFAPAYAGIVTSGVQYYIQGKVIKTMGPVIVTAFNPLRMIIVTALACIILSEQLFLGSIIGAIVVVSGLYLVVWGKSKEYKARNEMPPSPTKENSLQHQQQLPVTAPRNEISDNKTQLVFHAEEQCYNCGPN